MLFSATFPKNARDLAKTHLSEEHVRFRVGRAGSSHENIKQQIFYVQAELKRKALLDLLLSMKPCRTVIFVNNKRTADELDDYLFNQGIPCTSMHSDRTQKEREAAMRAFRGGKSPILIATGVTARGIDVKSVGHVVNYDLPSLDHGGIEEYTHRIGKTHSYWKLFGISFTNILTSQVVPVVLATRASPAHSTAIVMSLLPPF
jgi:ATP-dependent RNA helicase DDX3X